VVKALLFALLAIDTAYFVWSGATSKAIDAAAWLMLLALFDVDARIAARSRRRAVDLTLRAARLAAAAGVIVATLRYVFEDNMLDTINSALWIGVVLLLETQFRFPALAARGHHAFAALAAMLYGGLALLVVAWAWRREWFDAYDALVWLLAFAALELEVFSAGRTGEATPGYTPAEKT
jgi:hypothetical protein